METWQRVNLFLNGEDFLYWKKIIVNPYHDKYDLTIAIDKLLKNKRPYDAIDCIYKNVYDKKPLDVKRIVKALKLALKSNETLQTIKTYQIAKIIEAMQEDSSVSSDDLFSIEWAYLPLLDGSHGVTPKYLEKKLAMDSDFFCEIIQIAYRSKKEPIEDLEKSKQKKSIALNAWRLLHEWHIPPGVEVGGSFDEKHFNKWLQNVIEKCKKSGYLKIALSLIGQILFYSPADSTGLWINKAVAEALNRKDAEEIRNGFFSEAFNFRGVYWVDPSGKPERDLAKKYKAQANDVENSGYFRFANCIRKIADSFEKEADMVVEEHKMENDKHDV